jgi:hypothetical protein
VRQLLRNFWEVDLEVMDKDIVHGVLRRRLRSIEGHERSLVKGSSADVRLEPSRVQRCYGSQSYNGWVA